MSRRSPAASRETDSARVRNYGGMPLAVYLVSIAAVARMSAAICGIFPGYRYAHPGYWPADTMEDPCVPSRACARRTACSTAIGTAWGYSSDFDCMGLFRGFSSAPPTLATSRMKRRSLPPSPGGGGSHAERSEAQRRRAGGVMLNLRFHPTPALRADPPPPGEGGRNGTSAARPIRTAWGYSSDSDCMGLFLGILRCLARRWRRSSAKSSPNVRDSRTSRALPFVCAFVVVVMCVPF
jgi:hypothetical protein